MSFTLTSNRFFTSDTHTKKTGTVQEATASQIAANEISIDATEEVLLSQLDGIFTLKRGIHMADISH